MSCLITMHAVTLVEIEQCIWWVVVTVTTGGMSGLYGPGQNDWYLDEKGLMHADKLNQSQPKEPTTGFQLFATRPAPDNSDMTKNFDLVSLLIFLFFCM